MYIIRKIHLAYIEPVGTFMSKFASTLLTNVHFNKPRFSLNALNPFVIFTAKRFWQKSSGFEFIVNLSNDMVCLRYFTVCIPVEIKWNSLKMLMCKLLRPPLKVMLTIITINIIIVVLISNMRFWDEENYNELFWLLDLRRNIFECINKKYRCVNWVYMVSRGCKLP